MTIRGICDVARKGEPCTVCHVTAGQPCTAPHAVHLCRVCLAAKDGLLTMLELVSVMHDCDEWRGDRLILDGAA